MARQRAVPMLVNVQEADSGLSPLVGEAMAGSDVILRTEAITAFISPRWWPKNPGSVLVIPNEHYENVYSIPDDLLHQVQSVGKRVALAMKAGYQCDGTSFRQHNEPAGNQDVWHYRLHVFPRYRGDDLYLLRGRTTTPEERKTYADILRRCRAE